MELKSHTNQWLDALLFSFIHKEKWMQYHRHWLKVFYEINSCMAFVFIQNNGK